ncbi:MAG: TetR/AcrR family transcriptional regulator [Actinomycetota bacterium]|nr:TetR/AcrR family transcriptional regulator [Actinomycetota bacterium]
MTTDAAPRRSIREEHRHTTRRWIIDALVGLVTERGTLDFTVQEVAERSGVPLRTLYRHFPSRQHLVDALATEHDQVAAVTLPAGLDGYTDWLTLAWGNLLANQLFVRAQHTGSAGQALRRASIPVFRDVLRALLARDHPGLSPDRVDDLVDTCLLLSSSAALFELVDVQQVPPERAARIAAEAIVAVIRAG